MNKEQCLHAFWSSFGWKAYDETTVPDDAVLPRITYDVATSSFDNTVSLNASLWVRSTSWSEITAKANEIGSYIGRGGIILPYDGGAIWITRSVPWAQRMGDDDDTLRRIVLGITLEFID